MTFRTIIIIILFGLITFWLGWFLYKKKKFDNIADREVVDTKGTDSVIKAKKTVSADSSEGRNDTIPNDTTILSLAKRILSAFKNNDYKTIADVIHPTLGLRFSPYAYIDTSRNIKFTADNFLNNIKQQNKINWGNYDGSGDAIILTPDNYFKNFVYNADFLNADKTSLNKMIGSGNSLNNLVTIYQGCDFTESYFKGFEKKNDGMDWCCLRLVYKKYHDKNYLVAIIHDQWTI